MRIIIASDHAGFELKSALVPFLREELGHEVDDVGAHALDSEDDYPDFVAKAALAVSEDPSLRGIVIGGSGQGEAITANRFPGVRAVVFYGGVAAASSLDAEGRAGEDQFEIVRLSRQHNDANIISFGARFVGAGDAKRALEIWLETPFEGGRHRRRIEKIESQAKNILL